MRKTTPLILAALAALAGCGDAGEAPQDTAATGTPEAGMSVSATAQPTPAATSTDTTDEMAQTIPAALQGRWGMTPADCTGPRSDAKALLTIGSDKLTFYEAVGTLKSVQSRDASHIAATFAFTGEGMTWEREENLAVSGSTLTRKATTVGGQPDGPYTYERCAP